MELNAKREEAQAMENLAKKNDWSKAGSYVSDYIYNTYLMDRKMFKFKKCTYVYNRLRVKDTYNGDPDEGRTLSIAVWRLEDM